MGTVAVTPDGDVVEDIDRRTVDLGQPLRTTLFIPVESVVVELFARRSRRGHVIDYSFEWVYHPRFLPDRVTTVPFRLL